MSIPLTVNGLTFEFPTSQEDPDWSFNVSDWAKEITDAVNSVVGVGDLAVTSFSLDNANTFEDVTGCLFDTSSIQSSIIEYSIARSTDSIIVYEQGELHLLFDNDAGTWRVFREFTQDAQVEFNVTSIGQVQIKNATIAGANYVGKLTFRARALTN